MDIAALIEKSIFRIADHYGKLIPVKKVRGRKKAIQELLTDLMNSGIDAHEQSVYKRHGD